MKLEELTALSEHDLISTLDATSRAPFASADFVNALERALWIRYMPEVSPSIADSDLLVLGEKFKQIVTEKEIAFANGTL